MFDNYEQKLLQEIMTGNYQLVYIITRKCGNYRDTDVSKNIKIHQYFLSNYKRRNKGNYMLKSNSNKLVVWGAMK